MKDSKFIELLNLYVDHQISAEDAALLEAEIQRKPERRQIYRQYCQMQKACVTLAENFRTQAPVGGKIVAFAPASRRLTVVTYAMGFLAAAACVAVLVVNRNRLQDRSAAMAVQSAEHAQAQSIAEKTAIAPAPVRVALKPVFAVHENSGSAIHADRVAFDFDWMNQVQLERVPIEQLRFETQPTLRAEDLLLRSRPAAQAQTESIAIRFQR